MQQPPQWTPQAMPNAPPVATEEQDLAALSPFWPKVAAALSAVGGLCAVLGALQTWMTVEILTAMSVVPIINFVLGIAAIAVATRLASARRWAAIVALALGSLLTLSTGAWAVYAFANMFIAVFVIVGPLVCLMGVAFTIASLGPCDRAERARDRLYEKGLELGL